ncbi:hypothetical protein BJX64DRAFT_295504, partial [Aspergillus heterothallicus]
MSQNRDSFLTRTIHDLVSLQGRTIVITGGGRGLGLAFAFAIAEAGGNAAIIDYSDAPHEHFSKLDKEFPVKVKFYKSDVTNYDLLKATFDAIVRDFGAIHGLY